jgi:hypothetical protein
LFREAVVVLGTIYDAHLESLLPHPRAPYVIDRKYHPGSSEISEDALLFRSYGQRISYLRNHEASALRVAHRRRGEEAPDVVDEVIMQALEAARLPLPRITSNIA